MADRYPVQQRPVAARRDELAHHALERRTAAVFVALVVAGILLLVAMAAAAGPAQYAEIGLMKLGAATVQLILLAAFLGSLALAVGAITGRKGVALATVAIVGIVTYFANTLAPSVEVMAWSRDISPFRYYSAGGDSVGAGSLWRMSTRAESTIDPHRWWQSGVIYQVYPRSFQDSDGDGIGDLEGIRQRLDHLVWLGVDAIWISPFFPSPMVDFGYDISDYTDVDPIFGNLAAFDRLLAEAHQRDLRVTLDLVPNHTSDRHPWFEASRRSRASNRRDWYLWRDPGPDGGVPNNWMSEFGGSAWQVDEATGQYYYHAFAVEQPDLNWRNVELREAMFDVMRFWLDRGVDGFRVDVMWHMLKDEHFRDNPANPDYREGVMSPYHQVIPVYSTDQPEVHEVVAQMRAVLEEYGERLMIGEIYLPVDRLIDYYGRNGDGAHLPFNFHLISTAWDARELEVVIDRYEGALPDYAWPNWVMGNHDQSRIVSRLGPAQARVAAMLLLTLRGTPTIYYGEELGMHDVEIPPGMAVDVRETNVPGRGFGRDPERTPMQWDRSATGGFTTGRPWLPLPADVAEHSVEAERADGRSMLNLYRRLLALRRAEPALAVGSYAPLVATGTVLAYLREHAGRRLAIVLNIGSEATNWPLPDEVAGARIILSTGPRASEDSLSIGPNEGLILELAG